MAHSHERIHRIEKVLKKVLSKSMLRLALNSLVLPKGLISMYTNFVLCSTASRV